MINRKEWLKYKNKSGIYKIVNLINEKFYIGSAVNIHKRWHQHFNNLKDNNHDNIYLQRAWNKYGKDNFKFEVLEYVEDKSKLIEREQYYLNIYFDNCKNCYNILSIAGNTLGFKHSEETKRIIGEKNKRNPSSMKNKKHTEETKKKISEAHKGKKLSEETKLKLRKPRKHRKHKLRKGVKPFNVYDKNGKYIGNYDNQSECAKILNVYPSNINDCLKGKNRRKSTGGYTFMYILNSNNEKLIC